MTDTAFKQSDADTLASAIEGRTIAQASFSVEASAISFTDGGLLTFRIAGGKVYWQFKGAGKAKP